VEKRNDLPFKILLFLFTPTAKSIVIDRAQAKCAWQELFFPHHVA
jgi:hypothetical protein